MDPLDMPDLDSPFPLDFEFIMDPLDMADLDSPFPLDFEFIMDPLDTMPDLDVGGFLSLVGIAVSEGKAEEAPTKGVSETDGLLEVDGRFVSDGDVDSEGNIEGTEGFSEPMLGMLDGELDSFGGSVVKRMSSLKLND